MKITAILLLRAVPGGGADPVVLANASDVSQFGYFQRSSAKEFILFVARTIANRTPGGQRQSVQQDGLSLDPRRTFCSCSLSAVQVWTTKDA